MPLSPAVSDLIGERRHERRSDLDAERGVGLASCASVHNANPLFWDDATAQELTGGPILPPTTLTAWSRPHSWVPGAGDDPVPLQTHFDLKGLLDLPDAVVTASELVLAEPVRPGDRITHAEVLRSVSDEKETALGRGRFWVIDVDYRNQRDEPVGTETVTGFGYRGGEGVAAASDPTGGEAVAPPGPEPSRESVPAPGRLTIDRIAVGDQLPTVVHAVTPTTVVLGAVAARDWRPMHHDPEFARSRSGVPGIFLDTPTQAAWLERALTDWTGPTGRLGRLALRMRRPVVAGDAMAIAGTVVAIEAGGPGCGWISVDLTISVGGDVRSAATARIAAPATSTGNPWSLGGADWSP